VTRVTEKSGEAAGYKLTPVMQQYLDLKRGHADALLFFRLGDFYEMFFEDAERAASLLDLTLTTRNRNEEKPIPMCGVPHHAARGYISRLLDAGVKVAICEQIELPSRGIARREITRVVTPGTSVDEETLAPDRGNFLAAVVAERGRYGVAYADFSTGVVRATETPGAATALDELCGLAPREVLVAGGDVTFCDRLRELLPRTLLVPREAADGEALALGDGGVAHLRTVLQAPAAQRCALATLLAYIDATQGGNLSHLREAESYDSTAFLRLDRTTRRHLEVVESAEGTRDGSLLSVVDRCVTTMGKRLLREWLLRPLRDAAAIGERLDAVDFAVENPSRRAELRESLRKVGDMERVGGRIGAATATPRDLVRLADALSAAAELANALGGAAPESSALARVASAVDDLPELRGRIRAALVDEPPAQLGRGALIRDGHDPEVDRLRRIRSDGKGWMMEFEASEKRRTGIANLKVGFNKVFGYYIEISRAGVARAPAEYVRKQTIANGERYVTDELKRRESELLGAEERLGALEAHLFGQLLELAQSNLTAIGRTAAALSELDVLCGLAETAHACSYVRPEIVRAGAIEIAEGRHPVVETMIGQRFVPNDCRLGPGFDTVMIITGPNMGGKSTYMRQVALAVVLAHCGSFVPAREARIPLVDRVFTRIGASDRLAQGQSTFMVEMSETAEILRSMTSDSLVVLDEIGRGTSTYDGISIAWAVAEAMVRARVKTLFATHYHELAALAGEYEGVGNHSVGVRRYRGELAFLYRVTAGAASRSYGIEVAALAGVPQEVTARARELLGRLERNPLGAEATARQGDLFGGPATVESADTDDAARGIVDRLAGLDPERLTPVEALVELDGLVREARKRQ
jgi:DNA mismatch repair protein MutS